MHELNGVKKRKKKKKRNPAYCTVPNKKKHIQCFILSLQQNKRIRKLFHSTSFFFFLLRIGIPFSLPNGIAIRRPTFRQRITSLLAVLQVNYKCNGVFVLFEQTKGKTGNGRPLSAHNEGLSILNEGGPVCTNVRQVYRWRKKDDYIYIYIYIYMALEVSGEQDPLQPI